MRFLCVWSFAFQPKLIYQLKHEGEKQKLFSLRHTACLEISFTVLDLYKMWPNKLKALAITSRVTDGAEMKFEIQAFIVTVLHPSPWGLSQNIGSYCDPQQGTNSVGFQLQHEQICCKINGFNCLFKIKPPPSTVYIRLGKTNNNILLLPKPLPCLLVTNK